MPGLFLFGTIRTLIGFGGKGGNGRIAMPETERHHETDTSDRKYQQTTIGDLRKTYGATNLWRTLLFLTAAMLIFRHLG